MGARRIFRAGDTVRLVGGSPALLMTVQAASRTTVLCAWCGPSGKTQFAPYAPDDLDLVEAAGERPDRGAGEARGDEPREGT